MGDGVGGGANPLAEDQRNAPAQGFASVLKWLLNTRRGRLSIGSAVSLVLLATVVLWHAFVSPILDLPHAKTWFLAACVFLAFPLLLLLLDSPDNLARSPSLPLPLATSAILVALATVAAADQLFHLKVLSEQNRSAAPTLHLAAAATFLAYLSIAFLPRILNAAQFAADRQKELRQREASANAKRTSTDAVVRSQAEALHVRRRENDEAEALSALIATVIVAAICVLAYWAGLRTNGDGLRNAVGVFIAGGVILLFGVVVLLDWISEFPPVRAASRALRSFSRMFRWLASFYNAVDTVLVRIGAHVAGAEHFNDFARYSVLLATMLSLTAMAWFLPAPLGLAPAIIGFVLALSVSRLWAWVEDDRNMASITKFNPDAPRRVGFREDFRDETITAFIFVLVLIPIAMMQADRAQVFGQPLFTGDGKDNPSVWFGYFGFELAKALPIVDWADIYNLRPGTDLLRPNGATGMHAVFAARSTVDLVLIASLLQAISIANRNRQQIALYAAGHIDRLDELVEKVEMKRALALQDSKARTARVDFRRYNPERLKDVYFGTRDESLQGFIKRIFDQSGRSLDPAIVVLTRIAASHRNEVELHRTFDAVKREHDAEKPKASVGDLVEVMTNLRSASGLRDLKHEILEFAGKIGSPTDIADMTQRIIFGSLRDNFQYTRIAAAKLLIDVAPRIDDPSVIAEILELLDKDRRAAFGATTFVPDHLHETLEDRLNDIKKGRDDWTRRDETEPAAPSQSEEAEKQAEPETAK